MKTPEEKIDMIMKKFKEKESLEAKLELIDTELIPLIEASLESLKFFKSPKYEMFKTKYEEIILQKTETEAKIKSINEKYEKEFNNYIKES